MSPQRIQRKRTKGWRTPPCSCGCGKPARYVGRGSHWGNPFFLSEEWPTRADVLRLFRDLVMTGEAWWTSNPGTRWEHRNRWRVHPSQKDWLTPAAIRRDLAGHDLSCWCPLSSPCHADVLLELANA